MRESGSMVRIRYSSPLPASRFHAPLTALAILAARPTAHAVSAMPSNPEFPSRIAAANGRHLRPSPAKRERGEPSADADGGVRAFPNPGSLAFIGGGNMAHSLVGALVRAGT